jgi:hypothetical protein
VKKNAFDLLKEGKTIHDLTEEEKKELKKTHKKESKQIEELTEKESGREDKIRIELREIYENIVSVLKEFCDLKEEQYSLIAIWIIGTYIHDEFETYPYLFFNAMRGSGKTRILKLIAACSHKGELIGSLSEAVLFRTAKGRTMCLDEFERVGSKEKQSLRELLNAAYKKGQIIKRMKKKGDEFVVDEFEVFSPIAMANIWGMEEVLEDRCISLTLEKSDTPAIVKLIENFSKNPVVQDIRTKLSKIQCSLCSVVSKKEWDIGWNNYILSKYRPLSDLHKTTLYTLTTLNTYNTLTTQFTDDEFYNNIDKTGIYGRHLELSFPLLIISRLLNNFEETLKFLEEIMKEKKLEDMAESKDVQVYDFVSQLNESHGHSLVSNLTIEFRHFLNLSEKDDVWVNSKWLGRALKRLVLIKEKRRRSKGVEMILDVSKAKEKIKIFKEPDKKEEDIKVEKIK